jgi:SpoVK/Ycf46/Vps4 family AAA+-type ATPase
MENGMSRASFSLPGAIDVPSEASWDDLVLPDDCIQSLHEYITWVTHRDQVEHEWQGRVTGGPIALFSGPPGTGKTLAGRVLGNVLELDVYRADLGLLLSRYIGETEKNLNALFDAVAHEPMLLLFDEADSLLGKRSEVSDADDRYVNLQANYLMSRLERHIGPCVLTSNSKERIDPGFLRRLQFVIDFPLPDVPARSRLWRRYLPARAPIDRGVDTDDLAAEFVLTGGQIRNAALHAAFLAAAESSSITRKHITSAVQAELAKTGRS